MDNSTCASVDLILALLDLADELDGQLDEALAPMGLSPALFWLLDHMSEVGGLDPEADNEALQRPTAQLEALLGRLQDADLVERLSPTGPFTVNEQGAATLRRARQAVRPMALNFTDATSASDRRALARIVSALR
jgi:hypothetical protein